MTDGVTDGAIRAGRPRAGELAYEKRSFIG